MHSARATARSAGLTGNTIKWIAIAAMLIDHIAWAFVPTHIVPGQMMHIIGRITGPTMCFFIAEGYSHTHDIKKYIGRLAVFALISQIPYYLFETGKFGFIIWPCGFSVIYTLLCSLLAVLVWDRMSGGPLKLLALAGLLLLSCMGDWMCFDVIFALIFWQHRGNFKEQALYFSVAAAAMVVLMTFQTVSSGGAVTDELFQFGVLLCLPILSRYNGQRGGGKYSKWNFYIFYPAHLLAIGLIRRYLHQIMAFIAAFMPQ